MATAPLTISVDSDLAMAFANAQPADQKKMEMLLGIWLRELTTKPRKSLQQLMDEAGAEAERNGLTPEILAELLNEE
jgi:hypothetical protein